MALGKCNLIENGREKGGRVGRSMEGCDVVIFLILERYNNYLFIFVSGISKRHGTSLFKPVRSHTDRLYKLRNRSK